jgi:hypothetical protein
MPHCMQGHRPAVAETIVLYHVVHPSQPDMDEWTQDYILALAMFEQFARRYGDAHLHVETHRAGGYDAECLQRSRNEAAV